MTLPHVGASLGESLEARARRAVFPNVRCARCGLPPFPRGWIRNLEICWTCLRPGDGLTDVASRLEYLRQELRAERLSWGDVAELQSLADHIEDGDVELLEAAGVPEFEESE